MRLHQRTRPAQRDKARHKFNKRVLQMSAFGRTVLALVVALTSLGAISQRTRDPGVTDNEIRIGNVMPYTGALSAFGAIGRAEAAYFDMINERGGINGRKVRFI